LAVLVVGSSAACAPQRSAIADNTPSASAPTSSNSPGPTATSTSTSAGFNKEQFSLTDPTSYWVVVNKLTPLNPISYAPSDLVTVPVAHDNPAVMRGAASAALVAMFAAGAAEGAGQMQVQSSYRSYPVQVQVYNGWVSSLGKAQADRQSARPGFSEHQTGLAVDISSVPLKCSLAACFGTTPQGLWLAANAWRFGYLLRYPADKTPITGYEYEPWHFRYIGIPLATEMHKEGIETLEEFFGLPAAPDYAAG
jgi:D-alanyl-D-alanine carboxypeptidase